MLVEKRVDSIGFEVSKSAFVTVEVLHMDAGLNLLGNEINTLLCLEDFLSCFGILVYAKAREGNIGVWHCYRVASMALPSTCLDMMAKKFRCFACICTTSANEIDV